MLMSGVIIDGGGLEDKLSIRLSTKENHWIKNVRRIERTPEAMKVAEEYSHANTPGIQTRSLASSYNCIGMVFGSRRTVIEPDQLEIIFKDDNYYEILEKSLLKVGDLITYQSDKDGEIDHVGIIVNIRDDLSSAERHLEILSQFGFDGEYFHDEYCIPPFYGKFVRYFSERIRL
jgi:hypothetical protein